jgi:hypothetical protein
MQAELAAVVAAGLVIVETTVRVVQELLGKEMQAQPQIPMQVEHSLLVVVVVAQDLLDL